MIAFLCLRYAAHIAPVIIAQKNEHIIRHRHTLVVILQYLLIQSPYLRRFLGRTLGHFLDNAPLVLHDILQELGVGLSTHRLVTITTHTNGNQVFCSLCPLNTLTEELIECLLVFLVIPRTVLFAMASPFLMVPSHGLMVGCTDNNAHFIGQFTVLGVVSIESPAPHGRPQEITLQTENQLKHFLVEIMTAVIGAEGVLHPRRQTRSLVVDEDSTVSNHGLSIGENAVFDKNLIMMNNGNICPIIPGRHAQLLRQFIDAKDGASAVAACNDELLTDGCDDVFLELTLQRLSIDFLGFHQLVDGCRMTDGSDDNVSISSRREGDLSTAHLLQVGLQVPCSNAHAFQVVTVIMDLNGIVVIQQNVAIAETHKWFCSHDVTRCKQCNNQAEGT